MQAFVGIKELVTLSSAAEKDGRNVSLEDLSVVRNAAIVEHQGKIVWVGPQSKLKKNMKRTNLNAECVLPSFVECHTHLVFAGDRSSEFELRNQGVSYQEIAARGGGIQSTVAHTRKASHNELLKLAQARSDRFLAQGVTTLEVKSGYGLEQKSELKLLEVAKKIKSMRVISTYLGPHAVPKERDKDAYLEEVCAKTLPLVAKKKLASRVDMFIESGYYSLDDARKYFAAARALGFQITAHADQLTRTGAGAWLANMDALSGDHLLKITDADIEKISRSGLTAVLLPTSDFYLKINYPPARQLLDAGASVALATDFNPGTSPTQDISLVGVLARLEMKMTLPEVIVSYTLGAARALGLHGQLGSLELGKMCDFVVLGSSWRELFYNVGYHPVQSVYSLGIRKNLKKS